MFPKPAVWLLIALHWALAGLYAAIAPYRTPGVVSGHFMADIGAPDEMAHSQYVQYLFEGKGLPPAPEAPDMPTYEAHQPPLYYALAAAWAKIGMREDFDAFSTGYWLRWLNILIGGVGVLGIARMCWLATEDPRLTTASSTIAALLPMNVGVSASIGNDSLLIALGAWVAGLLVDVYKNGWTAKKAAAIGVLIGLSLLTKTSGLALFLPLAVCLYLTRSRARPVYWLAVPALALLIVSPIWIRNYILYQDPLLLRTFAENWKDVAIDKSHMTLRAFARHARDFIEYTTFSFFGMLGYMAIRLPLRVYLVLILGSGWLAYGTVKALQRQTSREERSLNWLIGSVLIAAMILYVRFNLDYVQPQARYFFTALGPVAYFLALGFKHWCGKSFKRAFPVLAMVMLIVNVMAVRAMIRDFHQMQTDLRDAGGPAAFKQS